MLQEALDDGSCATVLLPAPGRYLSRALNLSLASGKTLLISPGAALVVWPEIASYGAGTPHFLSSATSLRGFTLAGGGGDAAAGGGGRIVGGGAAWWARGSSFKRPHLVYLPDAADVAINGLTLIDSPSWNIGLRGVRLNITHVRVEAGMDSCGGFGVSPK